MSVGTRTRTLLKTISPAGRLDIAASYEALTQACVATGDDPGKADLVSDSPNHLWSLGSRSSALAIVQGRPPRRVPAWCAPHPVGLGAGMTFRTRKGVSMNPRGLLITIDGLSASGKTTVAPLVAAFVDGIHLTDDTLSAFPRMRAEVDAAGILPARFHWWMMANHVKSETARALIETGWTVVVESYFPRTIATHRAMGHDCVPEYPDGALAPHVPILLEVDERVRQERLRRRAELGTLSSWHRREEQNVAESSRAYRAYGLLRVDGTDRTPDEVARSIADIVRSRARTASRKATPRDRN